MTMKQSLLFAYRALSMYAKTYSTKWQDSDVDYDFLEFTDLVAVFPIPKTRQELFDVLVKGTQWEEWVEPHFQERMSGKPLNPTPSAEVWHKDSVAHTKDQKFSHTYPERYWPKTLIENGIRYKTGDLDDMIQLLEKEPSTRKAFLPVYFPEDLTAALEGERTPCSIGYHFQIRDGLLFTSYFMRSCDAIRHFRNDIYLTARLMQEVAKRTNTKVGNLSFHCSNFHCFENDRAALENIIEHLEAL